MCFAIINKGFHFPSCSNLGRDAVTPYFSEYWNGFCFVLQNVKDILDKLGDQIAVIHEKQPDVILEASGSEALQIGDSLTQLNAEWDKINRMYNDRKWWVIGFCVICSTLSPVSPWRKNCCLWSLLWGRITPRMVEISEWWVNFLLNSQMLRTAHLGFINNHYNITYATLKASVSWSDSVENLPLNRSLKKGDNRYKAL